MFFDAGENLRGKRGVDRDNMLVRCFGFTFTEDFFLLLGNSVGVVMTQITSNLLHTHQNIPKVV